MSEASSCELCECLNLIRKGAAGEIDLASVQQQLCAGVDARTLCSKHLQSLYLVADWKRVREAVERLKLAGTDNRDFPTSQNSGNGRK